MESNVTQSTKEEGPNWSQVQALSENMFKVFYVKDGEGMPRQMNCSDPHDPKKNDTRSCYYSKRKIDELFATNPKSDGLLIYFGVSDPLIYPCPKQYENKLTALLVPSIDGKPIVPAGGGIVKPLKTCPPDICG